MKMTTKEFLDHLGIEVGKPFMCDGEMFRVEKDLGIKSMSNGDTERQDWEESYWCLTDFLDKEITPLPKYTLTEDEKAIVRSIPKSFNGICRRTKLQDIMIVGRFNDEIDEYTSLPFYTMFNFLPIDEEVSLDELRKCL